MFFKGQVDRLRKYPLICSLINERQLRDSLLADQGFLLLKGHSASLSIVLRSKSDEPGQH